MPAILEFDRRFSDYGEGVQPAERAPEVLDIVEDFMLRWGYSMRNIIGADLSVQYLGGETAQLPDLIFKISGYEYFEIVIRGGKSGACYGGWLTGHLPITVSPEIYNGRPVLLTTGRGGGRIRHYFDPLAGYRPENNLTGLPLHAVRRLSLPE